MRQHLALPENLNEIVGIDNEFYAALAIHCIFNLRRSRSETKKEAVEFLKNYLLDLADPKQKMDAHKDMLFFKTLQLYDPPAAEQASRVGNELLN